MFGVSRTVTLAACALLGLVLAGCAQAPDLPNSTLTSTSLAPGASGVCAHVGATAASQELTWVSTTVTLFTVMLPVLVTTKL